MSVQVKTSRAAVLQSEVVYVNLVNGGCDFISEHGDGPCPFQARHFMVNENGGSAAACGHHVPDYWLDDDFGAQVFEKDEVTCAKWINREVEEQGDWDEEVNLFEPPSKAPLTHFEQCGYHAAVLLVRLMDGENYAACGYHARPSWLTALGMEEYDPHGTKPGG